MAEVNNSLTTFYKKYQKSISRIIWYIILVLLSIRGIGGYWSDLKNYIISSELEKKPNVIVVPEIDKNKELKARIFKEKGIILTDEDIKKYGINK